MDRNDFKDFSSVSKNFSEITTIKFNLCEVLYKKSHVSQNFIKESKKSMISKRRCSTRLP